MRTMIVFPLGVWIYTQISTMAHRIRAVIRCSSYHLIHSPGTQGLFFSGLAPHPPQLVQRAYRSNGIGNGCSKSVTVISSISHNRNYLWLPKCWTSAPPWASPYPARLSEIGPQVSLSLPAESTHLKGVISRGSLGNCGRHFENV